MQLVETRRDHLGACNFSETDSQAGIHRLGDELDRVLSADAGYVILEIFGAGCRRADCR
jgi:hypothetical protein